MPNIIEQQQDLEYFSDNQLLKEASQPSGTYPGYLVVAEITRRQGVRIDTVLCRPRSRVSNPR